MNPVVIRTQGLGKQYSMVGARRRHDTLRDLIMAAVRHPFASARRFLREGRRKVPIESFWALQEATFEIHKGEAVALIGRNGAGKTTLLRLLSRITEPTVGRAEIRGRVGSLLEVGTGFHPELSGRENVYLYGAILGMKRTEILRRFDEIIAFAELDRFIEMPVKHYSSGMYMRLAFAVAAHLEPEILLVDEVLAVGDAAFQKKCLGKMEGVAQQGRTVLFVSHSMAAVQTLCTRALWFQDGRIIADGPTEQVVPQYMSAGTPPPEQRRWEEPDGAPGNEWVRLRSARITPGEAGSAAEMTVRTPFDVEFEYWNLKPGTCLSLNMIITNQDGMCVFMSTTLGQTDWHDKPFPSGLFRSTCRVPGSLLNEGSYRVALHVMKDATVLLHPEDNLLSFQIHDDLEGRGHWYGKWNGVVRPRLSWRTEPLAGNGA